MSYTVSENQMLATMIAVLKDDGKTDLANILSVSKFNFDPTIFESFGFENVRLNFNYLDVIRQNRNDSGHPTGKIIAKEQFEMILTNYQAFLPKTIKAIRELPNL